MINGWEAGVKEEELLRLSFAQIERLFEAYNNREKNAWRRTRLIAYEIWRKYAKNAPDIDAYMPLEEKERKELTEEELKEIWRKYGKLKNN